MNYNKVLLFCFVFNIIYIVEGDAYMGRFLTRVGRPRSMEEDGWDECFYFFSSVSTGVEVGKGKRAEGTISCC